jgi:integrase/recombinase XerD
MTYPSENIGKAQLVGVEPQRKQRGGEVPLLDPVKLVKRFIDHLKARRYADYTISAYSRYLEIFEQYLCDRNISDLKQVTAQVIFDYHEKIMAEPIALASKALKIRPVRRLFKYLEDTHCLLINPADSLVMIHGRSKNIGTVLTIDEIKRLLNQPDLSLDTGIRDRAVMETFYGTGIRKNELLNLEIFDADLKEKTLYVRKGKGRKERMVPLGKNATRYLKLYLEKARPALSKGSQKEQAMFLNRSGGVLDGNALCASLRLRRIKAGIQKPVTPHTFRRTFATHLLQQGADIRYIQKMLGHKRMETTQIYTKVMPVEVKKMHERSHPKL